MEKLIDLHTHSIKSDGAMTPTEVVRHAASKGLSAISLTDHDVTDGVSEAVSAGKTFGIEVVPGIELSVQSKTETHILGYFIDITNSVLLDTLVEIKKVRYKRNEDTAKKLQEAGFDITMEDALALAPNGLVGRAHFARVMVSKGYTSSVKEAFDLYLSNGRPCYSSTQLLTPPQAVELIKTAGGQAYVAHLHLTRMDDGELYSFLSGLKNVGLDGIEGYYSEYTPEMQEKYHKLAHDLELKISGGTDFHGAMKPHIEIGRGFGNLKIPYSVLEEMKRN
ncbi:MAG: Error-prone DNA polymerase [Firmicutes bacterium ADurb.Bin193]|nr:MAG: Error-prone DNA polymerase [Firmicutes bacterium ADurb.Bin193]